MHGLLMSTCLKHQSCIHVQCIVVLIQVCYVTLKYNGISKTLEDFLIYEKGYITRIDINRTFFFEKSTAETIEKQPVAYQHDHQTNDIDDTVGS